MGLDMYLSKRHYFGSELGAVKQIDCKHNSIRPERVEQIDERIMYWRKANQIHNWFTTLFEEDDCSKEYDVQPDQLAELVRLCERVLEDHSLAEELLPTKGGFFFGSLDYDEYYFNDLQETVKVLAPEIGAERLCAEEGCWFVYRSSW